MMTYNNDDNNSNNNNSETIQIYTPLSSHLPPPPLHCLNNVLNERMPFLKILGFFLRFMFAIVFLIAFSFINNLFEVLNVKIFGVIYITFVNKD